MASNGATRQRHLSKLSFVNKSVCAFNHGRHNNSMDVRAKQRLCLLACLVSLTLRGGGFAPRHLNRSGIVERRRRCSRSFLWLRHDHRGGAEAWT